MIFRILNIIAIHVLGILIIVNYFGHVPWWGFALPVLAYSLIVFWGCAVISSGLFLRVLCRATTNEKIVALTFDDGPHPVFTARILNTLKQHNVKAAFFCIGKNIPRNEPLLKRIQDEGHTIGNHSYSHDFWFDLFSSHRMLADLRQMDETVAMVTGAKPTLFRPPYGVTNPNVKRAVKKGNYTPIGWSIRSLDTVANDKQKLLSRITGKLKAGDIILLHDSVEMTADVLPELIDKIKKKGFGIVPLDEMLPTRPAPKASKSPTINFL